MKKIDKDLEKDIKCSARTEEKKFKWISEIIPVFMYSVIIYILSYMIKYDNSIRSLYMLVYLISKSAIQYILVSYLIILSIMLVIKSIVRDDLKTNIVSTFIIFPVTVISYYKYKVLEQPFVPGDVLLIGNINEIAEFGLSFPPMNIIFSLLIIFLILIVQHIMKKQKSNIEKQDKKHDDIFRIIIFVVGIVLFYYTCISPTRYTDFDIQNDLSNNYGNMGGNAVFFMHLGDFYTIAPNGYSEDNIQMIKQESIDNDTTDIIENYNPNVIIIMNESFSNPNKINNVRYSVNPIKNIQELSQNNKNCITGNLITPVYGGGTSLPEFEMLTGLSSYFIEKQIFPYTNYIRSDMNSIVRTYKNNNYTTVGIHTNTENFYNRKNVYKYLGFDETVFEEDIENPEIKGGNISDNEFANQIIEKFEENDGRRFIFGVSMQNHMPYTNKTYGRYDIDIISDFLTQEETISLKNYVQGVYDGDLMYIKLVNYLKNIEEPTILVMFGDHLPTLNSIYEKSNYDFIDYYTTPYIIWANYDINYKGIAETTSPSNLSIDIMKLANIQIPWYLVKFEQLYEKYPVINNQYVITSAQEILESNEITESDIINDCRLLQYDLLIKKKYITVE